MRPYYEEPGIVIYHGDALEVLHELAERGDRFRAVCMDPPYASGTRTEAKKSTSGSMVRGQRWKQRPIENDQMTTQGFIWLMRETVLAFRDMLSEGDSVFSFIDWRQWPNLLGAIESTNLRVNQMIVWDKMSYGLGNGFRSQHELVMHASKGTPRVTDHGFGNVLRHRRDDDPDHPSPKPPSLLEDLLSVVTEVGDGVLDPYMGGGSMLEAAKALGRRAVGIECKEEHCESAAKKLRQQPLFVPRALPAPPVEHEQGELFGGTP